MKPLRNNVVIEEFKKDTQSESLLIINNDYNNSATGKVLFIGPKVKGVVVGDLIHADWKKAKPINFNDQKLFMVSEDDVLCVEG